MLPGAEQYLPHAAQEVSALYPKLVSCNVPGELRKRKRQLQWFRRIGASGACLNPAGAEIIGIASAPCGLYPQAPLMLAGCLFAGFLSASNSRIGPKPLPADTAWSLRIRRHAQSSSMQELYATAASTNQQSLLLTDHCRHINFQGTTATEVPGSSAFSSSPGTAASGVELARNHGGGGSRTRELSPEMDYGAPVAICVSLRKFCCDFCQISQQNREV